MFSGRYLRYREGEEELYDIANDPAEWHNLAGSEQHMDILKSMRKKLQSKLFVVAE